MSTVLTMGTFDLFHSGHAYLMKQCKRIAGPEGKVIATVNSDAFIERFKGHRPIQTLPERRDMLLSCRWVDEVGVNDGEDAKPVITKYAPDFLVIGSDWANKDYYAQLQISQTWLAQHDIALIYLDRLGDMSSTNLKERVRNQ